MAKKSKLLSLLIIIVVISSSAGLALREVKAEIDIIVNGGFETGDLSGWTIGGLGGHVEVLGADDFTPAIPVPEGGRFVLLSTGPGEINLAPGLDLDGNIFPDNDTATLRQTFTLLPHQVPATLSFRWNFLSADTGIGAYDDFFMVTLNGTIILAGSVPGALKFISPFPDVPPLDQINYVVTSYGLTDGSKFDDGSCGFQSFSYLITAAGNYTLEFIVADQGDRFFDSGLLIDAVRLILPPPPVKEPAPPPVPPVPPGRTPTPAFISLGNFSLSATVAQPNQPIIVSVYVTNSGGSPGGITLTLRINEIAEQTQLVTIPGGATSQITFTVYKAEPGTYKVAVDGLEGYFTVIGESSPAVSSPGISIALIIGTALIFATLFLSTLALILRRRV